MALISSRMAFGSSPDQSALRPTLPILNAATAGIASSTCRTDEADWTVFSMAPSSPILAQSLSSGFVHFACIEATWISPSWTGARSGIVIGPGGWARTWVSIRSQSSPSSRTSCRTCRS